MKNLKIQKAKSALILDQPFFASILLSMPITVDESIPTMATDGQSIKINEKFVESLTHNEVLFVLAHETLHCVFQHMCRRGTRNANKFNIAADYVINQILTDEKIGSMPNGGLLDKALFDAGKGTAEGIYNLLPADCEGKAPGTPGGSIDNCVDAGSLTPKKKNEGEGDGTPGGGQGQDGTPGNGQGQGQDGNTGGAGGQYGTDASRIIQIESDLKVKVIQARNAAKMQNKLGKGIAKLVNDLTAPVIDWREILRRFITVRAKNEFTFARPKRRFMADDLNLPSLQGEKLGEIIIAVDCSASIYSNKKVIDLFNSEMKAIFQDTTPQSVKVIYFDDGITGVELFDDVNNFEIKPIGGAGTDFAPIFKSIDESLDAPPVACIVFTDLECNSFGDIIPNYPVLWAAYGNCGVTSVPFGDDIVKIGVE